MKDKLHFEKRSQLASTPPYIKTISSAKSEVEPQGKLHRCSPVNCSIEDDRKINQ